MKRVLTRWAERIWYQDHPFRLLLWPLSIVFGNVVKLRRLLYRNDILKFYRLPVPVVVVGNITVGGTGKTPLTLWLAEILVNAGYKPGIISRGYGGNAQHWPQVVTETSDVNQVGDEALLMAMRKICPVVIGPSRVQSGQKLLAEFECDVILSDDGLQHYRLKRDIEIVVIDGKRRFGNGLPLPAGPLREPEQRLTGVDFIVANGADKMSDKGFVMHLQGHSAHNLKTGEVRTLSNFIDSHCHAVAGIGNPQQFFNSLQQFGLKCSQYSFPDHHPFSPQDIEFNDGHPVLMTEKDAVKCKRFATRLHWYVPISVAIGNEFEQQFLALLQTKYDR